MRLSAAAAGLAFALFAPAVSAQEVPPRGRHEPEFGLGVAVHGRFSVPFGSADRDIAVAAGGGGAVVAIDEHLSWADLFDPGWGAEAEFDLFIGSSGESLFGPDASFRFGVYLAVGLDHFGGRRAGDDLGNTIDADGLDMATVLVGGKLVSSIGDGSRVDGRFGLGAVRYSAVDAVVSGPATPAFEAELLEETWTLAAELRGHWGVELGPVSLVLGLGFRAQVPPREGASAGFSPGPFFTFDGDLGLEIAF